jgi:hypothetical protein
VILELGLGEVVHLLDPGRVDPAVLDQLLERRPRHLASEPVEGGEDDGLRRVVDDEVDAGEVLERTDVAALPADDAALHVVGRQRDDGDGRLGGVTGRDALERVGDERAGAAARLRPRLLLLLADAARELVADQVLGALEQVRLRLRDREPTDPLQLGERPLRRRLQVVLELLDVHLAVREPLLPALELDPLALELVLAGGDLLLDARGLGAPVAHLRLDLRAQLHRELARLDLRLAAGRLRLAPGDVDGRAAAQHQQRRGRGRADRNSDDRRQDREHAVFASRGRRWIPRPAAAVCSHPALGLQRPRSGLGASVHGRAGASSRSAAG